MIIEERKRPFLFPRPWSIVCSMLRKYTLCYIFCISAGRLWTQVTQPTLTTANHPFSNAARGRVRMAERSKAPDSRCWTFCSQCRLEASGPRMWAWVRIPLLTNFFFFPFFFKKKNLVTYFLPGTPTIWYGARGYMHWTIMPRQFREFQYLQPFPQKYHPRPLTLPLSLFAAMQMKHASDNGIAIENEFPVHDSSLTELPRSESGMTFEHFAVQRVHSQHQDTVKYCILQLHWSTLHPEKHETPAVAME